MPAVICAGVAPRARASAEECRVSRVVAQAMKIALTAARMMSMTESTVVTWSSRRFRGSFGVRGLFAALVAWVTITAMIPLAVIAVLAVASTSRRGRRGEGPAPTRAGG